MTSRKLRLRALPLLLLSICVGNHVLAADSVDHLQRAEDYRVTGDLSAALIEFRNAVRQDPRNGEARRQLGHAYLAQGDGTRAAKELRRAMDLGIPADRLYVDLGLALFMAGDPNAVLTDLDLRQVHSPTIRAKVISLRGQAHARLQQWDEARSSYQTLLTLVPNSGAALLGLASLSLDQRDLGAAADYLSRALAHSADSTRLWSLRGKLHFYQGDDTQAERDYHTALRLAPSNIEALSGLALSQINSGQLALAKDSIARLRKVSPNILEADFLDAARLQREGKDDEAREHLTRVLSDAPKNLRAILLIAAIHFHSGAHEQALTYLKKAQRIQPGIRAKVVEMKAITELRLQMADAAFTTLDEALTRQPDDLRLLAVAAQAALQQQNQARANRYLQAIAKIGPSPDLQIATDAVAHQDWAAATAGLDAFLAPPATAGDPDSAAVMAALIAGQAEAALFQARNLAAERPNDAAALNLLAIAAMATGDVDLSLRSFRQALKWQPGNTVIRRNLARLLRSQGQIDQAEQQFERVLTDSPADIDALSGLVEIALQQQRDEQAQTLLERGISAHPDHLGLTIKLARLHADHGDYERALELANQAYGLKPGGLTVLETLGTVNLLAGNYSEANDYLARWTTVAPESATAWLRLAQAQALAGDIDAAFDTLESGATHVPNDSRLTRERVRVRLRDDDHEQALAIIDTVIVDQPDAAWAYRLRGDTLATLGRRTDALTAYLDALTRVNDSGAVRDLFTRLVALDAGGDAAAPLHTWLEAHPEDLPVRGLLATALLYRGELDGAAKAAQAVLLIQPDNIAALNNLAVIYSRQGKLDGALTTARHARQVAPNHPGVADTLGWILVQSGDATTGLALLITAAKRLPDNPELAYHLATAYLDTGQRSQARAVAASLPLTKARFPGYAEAQRLWHQLGQP